MCAYEIITRQEVFSGRALHYQIIIGNIIYNGERPNMEIVNEIETNHGVSSEQRDMIAVMKNLMVQCWKTEPKDRPTIVHGESNRWMA